MASRRGAVRYNPGPVSIRNWFSSERSWWRPYLGVVSLALATGLLLLLFILANAAEILKTLRTAGG